MTGEKNRFKTHEKLWNLDDKQLKTPVHDALVLWLMDENNLKLMGLKGNRKEINHVDTDYVKKITGLNTIEIPCKIIVKDSVFYGHHHVPEIAQGRVLNISDTIEYKEDTYDIDRTFRVKRLFDENYGEYSSFIHGDYFNMNEIEDCGISIFEIESEVPIMSSSTFIGGYADLIIDVHNFTNLIKVKNQYKPTTCDFGSIEWEEEGSGEIKITYEVPNLEKYNIEWISYDSSYLIEVKPYIDSFGSVLRQLKTYDKLYNQDILSYNQTRYNKKVDMCLFTLDDKFDKQFESQGIKVLHPPKDFNINEYMEEMGLN